MSPETASSRSLVRWVLPAALFAASVAAIAWIAVNLPRGATKPPPPAPPPTPSTEPPVALHFPRTRAIWDANDPDYAKECESDIDDHYDFPFLNPTDKTMRLGLSRTSCDCTKVSVTSLAAEIVKTFDERGKRGPVIFPVDESWTWTALKESETEGVEIPPRGGGVVRIIWNSRKPSGSALNLRPRLWMHPADDSGARAFVDILVPTKMSEPIRYFPDRLSLGTVIAGGEEKGEYLAWSPTRDALDVRVDPAKTDPLLDVQIERIDEAQAKALETKLIAMETSRLSGEAAKEYAKRTEEMMKATKIKTPYRIAVTLREQKDGKHLDQGPLNRELPLMSKDTPIRSPSLSTFVRGEIEVGLPEDAGKANLKTFSAKDGIRKSIPIWSDAGAELMIESVSPLVLEVKLIKNVKESTPTRGKWTLNIAVPPGAHYGPFGDEAVILLRTNSTPPKRMRIPVTGNAGI
jgi:hypothetical protein